LKIRETLTFENIVFWVANDLYHFQVSFVAVCWSCLVISQKAAHLYSMLALLIAPFALCYQFLGKTNGATMAIKSGIRPTDK